VKNKIKIFPTSKRYLRHYGRYRQQNTLMKIFPRAFLHAFKIFSLFASQKFDISLSSTKFCGELNGLDTPQKLRKI
jgi:hypothetical protein